MEGGLKVASLRIHKAAVLLAATLLGSLFLSGASSQEARRSTFSFGDLKRIADVQLPPAGTKLMLHVAFPAGRPYALRGESVYGLSIIVNPNGRLRVVDQERPGRVKTVQSQRSATRAAVCSDRAFTREGTRWRRARMPIRWKWGRGIPHNLGRRSTRRALGRAHSSWASLRSNCRHGLGTYVRFRYKGRTGRSLRRDGVNLVDFGRLGSGALGATYTWFQDGRILESDLRLNSGYRWTNGRRGRGFSVANVAVHELGHQLGLGHVGGGHNGLTMYSVSYPGEIKKLTLGRGDLRGIAALYGR